MFHRVNGGMNERLTYLLIEILIGVVEDALSVVLRAN